MSRRDPTPAQWSLTCSPPEGAPQEPGAAHLVTPPISGSSLSPLLAGLLPHRDYNEGLVGALEHMPRASAGAQPVFSIFAADPFIEGKRFAQRLLAKGYRRIVNWPTTAQYGADFGAQLDSVAVGPRQEYENLRRLADRGLRVSVAVCTAEAAAELGRLEPEIMFLAPTFDLWSNGRMRPRELLRRCAALAGAVRAGTPIVLMAARGTVSLGEARKAGATALLSA